MTKRPAETAYLNSARVAKILGTTKRTLHNWIHSGRIPAPDVNPDNGYYRWTLGDVEAIRLILQEKKG